LLEERKYAEPDGQAKLKNLESWWNLSDESFEKSQNRISGLLCSNQNMSDNDGGSPRLQVAVGVSLPLLCVVC
jgi:hypothetical protein